MPAAGVQPGTRADGWDKSVMTPRAISTAIFTNKVSTSGAQSGLLSGITPLAIGNPNDVLAVILDNRGKGITKQRQLHQQDVKQTQLRQRLELALLNSPGNGVRRRNSQDDLPLPLLDKEGDELSAALAAALAAGELATAARPSASGSSMEAAAAAEAAMAAAAASASATAASAASRRARLQGDVCTPAYSSRGRSSDSGGGSSSGGGGGVASRAATHSGYSSAGRSGGGNTSGSSSGFSFHSGSPFMVVEEEGGPPPLPTGGNGAGGNGGLPHTASRLPPLPDGGSGAAQREPLPPSVPLPLRMFMSLDGTAHSVGGSSGGPAEQCFGDASLSSTATPSTSAGLLMRAPSRGARDGPALSLLLPTSLPFPSPSVPRTSAATSVDAATTITATAVSATPTAVTATVSPRKRSSAAPLAPLLSPSSLLLPRHSCPGELFAVPPTGTSSSAAGRRRASGCGGVSSAAPSPGGRPVGGGGAVWAVDGPDCRGSDGVPGEPSPRGGGLDGGAALSQPGALVRLPPSVSPSAQAHKVAETGPAGWPAMRPLPARGMGGEMAMPVPRQPRSSVNGDEEQVPTTRAVLLPSLSGRSRRGSGVGGMGTRPSAASPAEDAGRGVESGGAAALESGKRVKQAAPLHGGSVWKV